MITRQLVGFLNNCISVVNNNDLVATDSADARLQLTRRQSGRSVVLWTFTDQQVDHSLTSHLITLFLMFKLSLLSFI